MAPMKELLKKLVKADSTLQSGELTVAEILADFFNDAGVECRVDRWNENRANFIAHIKSTQAKPALLFLSHLDVVPPGEAEWKLPPFDAVEQDNKIHGRGACDMKGGIAASATAIAELVREKAELKGDIIFAATAGEETDSAGTTRFVSENIPNLPETFGAVIPEPTDFEIVTAHRGTLWLKITTKGKTAHGSTPELGINAIELMNALLNYLKDYKIPHAEHPLLGNCSMSINEIHGGKAANVVPDECFITIDIRTLPNQDYEQIIENFRGIFDRLKANDNRFQADISNIRSASAMVTDSETAFVKSFCRFVEIEKTRAVGFTTDGPSLAELGLPVVVFGPGKPHLCHKPDEYIDLLDLDKAKEYYKKIIKGMLT